MATTIISDYIGSGLDADKPTGDPGVATGAGATYFATDTGILYAWDGSAWTQVVSAALKGANITLNAAAINTLNSVPVEVVAAPGASKIVVPVRVMWWVTRTASAFSATPSFSLRWAGIATDLFTGVSFFLTTASAGETFRDQVRTDINFGYGGSDPRNLALQVRASADSTGGTGTVRLSVLYYIANWA